VILDDHPTDFTGGYTDKKAAGKDLQNIERLTEDAGRHVACTECSSIYRPFFKRWTQPARTAPSSRDGLNPQGVQVTSFKRDPAEEADHDFL